MGILSRGFGSLKKLFTKPGGVAKNISKRIEGLPVVGGVWAAIVSATSVVIALMLLLVGGYFGWQFVKPRVM